MAEAFTDILYVTYGAGHAFGINLDKWFDKVQLLLGEVGGLGNGFKLYRWPDYFIKKKE